MNGNKFRLVIAGIVAGCIQVSIIIGMLVIPSGIVNSKIMNLFSDGGLSQEYSSNKSDKNEIKTFLKKLTLGQNDQAREVILYNGITIDEGVKSNEEINNEAALLTQNSKSDREKAKILYTWVGSNIKYDDNKADEVLKGSDIQKMPEGGAISAFKSRTGICFDKACLYVAMARAADLKVRLVGGQAYNGEEYVGHAWNQVYLSDEGKWVNVDPTFYDGGNYFDSNLFDQHKEEEVAGEWQ
ncbi:transglutaminase-like domain-containing protein [Clostridium sp. BL-8]|uniref:transglutaminase-like domain-containing protein n=1 Tax=Clostridium sp. BL-8 TaxID=349938 RepID=UPI00098C6757|nr:transglutaminase-like domain-containing protein [Clostridium sp. BL-8]OOM79847.1 transglutaminase-like superfamily protein [Clostridium sp. BL-8]